MAEKKKKERSKGGFLTLLGAVVMGLGTLVPYQISLLEESFIDKARFLLNFQEVLNAFGSGLGLEQTLIIALVALPVLIFLLALWPVLQKQFSRIRLITLVLSLIALGMVIYLGYPLVEGSLQELQLVSPGPGLWLYSAGSAMAVLGGLEVL
jgi:hypothetical protein